MPFLKISTNVDVNAEKQNTLLQETSRLLATETGKPESYVMVELKTNAAMLFGGNSQPLAYLECKSIGLSKTQTNALSAKLPELLNQHLNVAKNRIYIEFSNCPAEFWGWNGSTFG